MIAYMCKYAPIEIIEAFNTPVVMMEPKVTNFTQADTQMHPNMCSYIKAVLEEFEQCQYEGMLFTTCCDSSRRLFDVLKRRYPNKFFFCFDLPRKNNAASISLYKAQIVQCMEQYAAFSNQSFDADRLVEMCGKEFEMQKRKKELLEKGLLPTPTGDVTICLAGARPGAQIKQLIGNLGAQIALDLTCTGITREYVVEKADVLGSYTKSLLQQMPCMRMSQVNRRSESLKELAPELDGIIYHTVKFCDIYSYEYAMLKEEEQLPILKLETDATSQGEGQILTRVEAFLESLRGRKASATQPEQCHVCCTDGHEAPRLSSDEVEKDYEKMAAEHETMVTEGSETYVLGIDSGSTSTNAVILNKKKEMIGCSVLRTGAKSMESAERILCEVLNDAGLQREDLDLIVATGYGRVSIPFADYNVTEISCHGKGAHFLNPQVRTILDIGGQDSKAIRLNEKGDVVDFVMNDKCAAGTGRFLEMMARTLEIDIEELGPISLQAKEFIQISSMCSVFAESEVISLIAQNKETADIAAGIHHAIAGKALSLLKRVGIEQRVMMTGGVAKNPGVVKVLEDLLKEKLFLSEQPELVGALGAALFGMERLESAKKI